MKIKESIDKLFRLNNNQEENLIVLSECFLPIELQRLANVDYISQMTRIDTDKYKSINLRNISEEFWRIYNRLYCPLFEIGVPEAVDYFDRYNNFDDRFCGVIAVSKEYNILSILYEPEIKTIISTKILKQL